MNKNVNPKWRREQELSVQEIFPVQIFSFLLALAPGRSEAEEINAAVKIFGALFFNNLMTAAIIIFIFPTPAPC